MSNDPIEGALACPFCGGPPEHDPAHFDGSHIGPVHDHIGHAIYCADMSCIGCPSFSQVYETEAEAVAAWNQRATLAAKDAEIAGLRERLAEAEHSTDEDTYKIGVRDGYEEAIQDLDLATGGDGEFKGSTFPGETVDVPVMKARIVERFVDAEALSRELAEVKAGLMPFSHYDVTEIAVDPRGGFIVRVSSHGRQPALGDFRRARTLNQ